MSTFSKDYLHSLFSLEGRTALCTGATRGIGAKMAIALASAGAKVLLVQRSTENTATLDHIRSFEGQAEIVVCDLSDAAAVKQLVRKVVEAGHVLDIVVNCKTGGSRHPD